MALWGNVANGSIKEALEHEKMWKKKKDGKWGWGQLNLWPITHKLGFPVYHSLCMASDFKIPTK